MLSRLVNVIYWASAAFLFYTLAILVFYGNEQAGSLWVLLGVFIFSIGWSIRYITSGKKKFWG
jgi:hypothetical protein